VIVISEEMFDKVVTHASAIAEEQFRRLVFDTAMRPEAAEAIRQVVVDNTAERIIEEMAGKVMAKHWPNSEEEDG
jgi:arginine/lysine/ornithine decarboxylase